VQYIAPVLRGCDALITASALRLYCLCVQDSASSMQYTASRLLSVGVML
jgi:hypothetical protein